MSVPVIKMTLESKELMATLNQLPERLNERARKTGARRALAPFVKDLAKLWKSSMYRGKKTHRQAIASATQMDVRRTGAGPSAQLRAQIGIRYGAKGGARAKGRQRIYHILESGFRHFGGGSSFYASAPQSLASQRDARRAFVKEQRDAIWKANPGNTRQAKQARSSAMYAMYAEARSQFKELADYTSTKRKAMDAAKGSAKTIRGAFRSYRWARANLQKVMDAMARETLAEAKKLLSKGGKP
jgi:hypothetical protein